jgi:hypothetical protein
MRGHHRQSIASLWICWLLVVAGRRATVAGATEGAQLAAGRGQDPLGGLDGDESTIHVLTMEDDADSLALEVFAAIREGRWSVVSGAVTDLGVVDRINDFADLLQTTDEQVRLPPAWYHTAAAHQHAGRPGAGGGSGSSRPTAAAAAAAAVTLSNRSRPLRRPPTPSNALGLCCNPPTPQPTPLVQPSRASRSSTCSLARAGRSCWRQSST